MGSIGIGCTINKGVWANVLLNGQNDIYFNDTWTDMPTVSYVVRQLTKKPISIYLKSELPLGCGFGLSGASTLACAYAINQYLHLNKTRNELAFLAHKAEIINRTGLGTVGTCIRGGFLRKIESGIPVKAVRYPFGGQKLYATVFDKIDTSAILSDKQAVSRINSEATKALRIIKTSSELTLPDIIDASFQYVLNCNLAIQRQLFLDIYKLKNKSLHATLAIFGKTIIASSKPDNIQGKHFELTISNDTVKEV